MTAPRNPWIMTSSGRAFDLVEPTSAMVHWPDVAEQLAKTPRFAGATPGVHYSVAQHSVLVAQLVSPEWRPWALLHDAHEAWLGDDTTPKKAAVSHAAGARCALEHGHRMRDLKDALREALGEGSMAWSRAWPVLERTRIEPPDYAGAVKTAQEQMRRRIDLAVWAAAGLGVPCDACQRAVKHADLVALSTERRDLMPKGIDAEWDIPLHEPDPKRIKPLPWPKAMILFQQDMARTFPHLQLRSAA